MNSVDLKSLLQQLIGGGGKQEAGGLHHLKNVPSPVLLRKVLIQHFIC
jgi:hypothetical protein